MATIVILEDELAVMRFLQHMLKHYSVIEANTAEEAIRAFTTEERQIDLLIADVTLPRSSGIHVALLLRSLNPSLPVILTSGYPMSDWSDDESADLKRLGRDLVAILQKPFQAEALLHMVEELIGAADSEKARTA